MPARSVNHLQPDAVKQLPAQLHTIVISAYNDALAPIFLYIVPLLVVALLILVFIKEKPLAKTIRRTPSTSSPKS